jgi:hypothetical protein
MKAGNLIPFFALVAGSLSGCLGHQAVHGSVSTSASPSHGTTSSTIPFPPPPPVNGTCPHKVEWSGCQGWHSQMEYPDQLLHHAQQDPNWGSPTGQSSIISMDAVFCPRVSWGPFERPLNLVIDRHDDQHAPDSCFPDTSNLVLLNTLSSLWVNDRQVADWLKQTYHMPVYYSEISFTNQTLAGPITDHVTTWGLNGSTNEIRIPDEHAAPFPETLHNRLFWYNQTGVSMMDMDIESTTPTAYPPFVAVADRSARGTVYPPMIVADVSTNYVGQGVWGTYAMTGNIQMFRDHVCKQPWP